MHDLRLIFQNTPLKDLLECDLQWSMVDKLPKDLSEISDIKAMRVMMSQLIVTIEQQTKSIDKLTQIIELKDDEIKLLRKMVFGKKSERIVPIDKEVKRRRKKDPDKAKQEHRTHLQTAWDGGITFSRYEVSARY